MTNDNQEDKATGNLFVMLGQLYAENQLLRQRITLLEQRLTALQQQIEQGQRTPANGKEPDESAEVAKKAKA